MENLTKCLGSNKHNICNHCARLSDSGNQIFLEPEVSIVNETYQEHCIMFINHNNSEFNTTKEETYLDDIDHGHYNSDDFYRS